MVWARLAALQAGAMATVLIEEAEPVAFAATFFAAVYLGVPVALADPYWGQQAGQSLTC